ncbi:MAG: hypothetical protein IRZ05_20195 [Micromonosporaceae bacterium]|nr:hypothetical protein [Micromonosporaceae bacterium]
MSAATALAHGRAAAERLMVDQCVVRRQTGTVTDPDTGRVTPVYITVYEGKCRVQQQQVQARAIEPGEAHLLMLRLEVHLPMSVTGVAAGDEVVITSSAHDPDLAGRVFIVRELAHKSHATARRLGVEERTS